MRFPESKFDQADKPEETLNGKQAAHRDQTSAGRVLYLTSANKSHDHAARPGLATALVIALKLKAELLELLGGNSEA